MKLLLVTLLALTFPIACEAGDPDVEDTNKVIEVKATENAENEANAKTDADTKLVELETRTDQVMKGQEEIKTSAGELLAALRDRFPDHAQALDTGALGDSPIVLVEAPCSCEAVGPLLIEEDCGCETPTPLVIEPVPASTVMVEDHD